MGSQTGVAPIGSDRIGSSRKRGVPARALHDERASHESLEAPPDGPARPRSARALSWGSGISGQRISEVRILAVYGIILDLPNWKNTCEFIYHPERAGIAFCLAAASVQRGRAPLKVLKAYTERALSGMLARWESLKEKKVPRAIRLHS